MLCVRYSAGKGRGIFAERPFRKGETIEHAPVLVIPAADWPHVEKTVLFQYCFCYGPRSEAAAIALGFGSLYNHSYQPNAVYVKRPEEQAIDFVALRDIEAGEEITVNYNGAPDDQSPIWFEVHD